MFEAFYEMYEPEEQEVIALISHTLGAQQPRRFLADDRLLLGADVLRGWQG